jgi:hypothetical protein
MAKEAVLGMLVLAVGLAGCTSYDGAGAYGGYGGPGGAYGGAAGGQSVSNQPGAFTYSAGGTPSGTQSFDWQNPSPRAHVSFSGGGAGSASVHIKDAAGNTVFKQTFSGAGGASDSVLTAPGIPGEWTIRVSLAGAGGFTLSVTSA